MSTEMSASSMLSDMKMAKQAYEAAKLSGIGVARAKERMMNTAFNYYDELMEAITEREKLLEENAMLLDSLDKADAEAKPKSKGKGRGEPHGVSEVGDT